MSAWQCYISKEKSISISLSQLSEDRMNITVNYFDNKLFNTQGLWWPGMVLASRISAFLLLWLLFLEMGTLPMVTKIQPTDISQHSQKNKNMIISWWFALVLIWFFISFQNLSHKIWTRETFVTGDACFWNLWSRHFYVFLSRNYYSPSWVVTQGFP